MLRARNACGILYRKTLTSGGNKVLILCNETYVAQDPQEIPSRSHFDAVKRTCVQIMLI
jgi:hypothetical protein